MESPTSAGFRQSVSAALYFSEKELDLFSEILYTFTFPLSGSLYRISFLLLASIRRQINLLEVAINVSKEWLTLIGYEKAEFGELELKLLCLLVQDYLVV